MSGLAPIGGFSANALDAGALTAGGIPSLPVNQATGPKVDYCRPDYVKMLPKWKLLDDVSQGQQAIKDEGAVYLPIPFVSDDATENRERYKSYLERAVFYNVTQRTLNGLVGEVFATDPVLDMPNELEFIKLDVDGGGVSLDQQARNTLRRVLAQGRSGLYVDYPTTDVDGNAVHSLRDQLEGNLRPVIYECHPADVINWRIELVGSRRLLTLVVIRESVVQSDDGFKESLITQFRALRLKKDETGKLVYYQQLYRKDVQGNLVQFGADIIPTDHSGQTFNEILFTFVGSDNNDPSVAEPPLYDMAVINIAHYRNSADYEESCFMLGNPTPWFAGLTEQWVKDVLKGKVMLGSRAAVALPENGSAGLLQVEPNTMVFEAMKHKEDQLRALGAKLVDNVKTTKTATQDVREASEDSSILAACTVNVSSAYSKCLNWAALFQGVNTKEVKYSLNTDFSTAKMSPAERMQLMKEWQGGAVSWEEYRFRLHRAGVATMEDKEARAAIDEETAQQAEQAAIRSASTAKIVGDNAAINGQSATGGST